MSFWSTLASIFRTPRRLPTAPITFLVWQNGGALELFAMYPRELAANLRVDVQALLPDATSKSFEQQFDFGIGSTVLWTRFPLSPCHPSHSPETGGSPEARLLAFFTPRDEQNTSSDLSLSDFIPDHAPGRSSNSNGTG
jgi:hypothetical protein